MKLVDSNRGEMTLEISDVEKEKALSKPIPNNGGRYSFFKDSLLLDKIFGIGVMIIALSTVITILLIFIFLAKETLPIFVDESVWKDASISKMLFPQVFEGYSKQEFIWQPTSDYPKFSIIPLIVGSIKATLVAILFGTPLGVGAAIYTSQFGGPRIREIVKPVIELLAGIPSVVLGFFALMVMATWFQDWFGLEYRLNTLTAGVALSIAIIPIIYTITEDSLNVVPKSYSEASLSLGANKIQTTWRIIVPAALPGIFAAIVLGFGRAVGETMIVLMASGNASIISASITDSVRTISATIAAELGEVVFGGPHYTVLFFLGSVLFIFTFILNYIGDVVVHKVKKKLSGHQ